MDCARILLETLRVLVLPVGLEGFVRRKLTNASRTLVKTKGLVPMVLIYGLVLVPATGLGWTVGLISMNAYLSLAFMGNVLICCKDNSSVRVLLVILEFYATKKSMNCLELGKWSRSGGG